MKSLRERIPPCCIPRVWPRTTWSCAILKRTSVAYYEDHKLPSVATRDVEHAGHDSYLALQTRDPRVRSTIRNDFPVTTGGLTIRDSSLAIRDLGHDWRVTNRNSPLVTRDLGLLNRESRVTGRKSRVTGRKSRPAGRGSQVASREPAWLADWWHLMVFIACKHQN